MAMACQQSGDARATADRSDGAVSSDSSGSTNEAAVEAGPSAGGASARKAMIAAFLANPKAELTPAIEEALLLDFDGRDPSPQAPSVQTADTNWKAGQAHPRAAGMSDDAERWQALATKHLGDPSIGVRYECVELWHSSAADEPAKAAFVAAAAAETSPVVQARMLVQLARGPRDLQNRADVQALFLKSADSPSADVRKAAVVALLDPSATGVPGAFEKAAGLLASDPSDDVRYQACYHLYGTHDARAIPLFDKYVNDPATSARLSRGCWIGLQSAWIPMFVDYGPPNADAFRLTVAALEKTPRTTDNPPANIADIADAPVRARPGDRSEKVEWRAAAKAFLDLPRLTKALAAVVLDPAAGEDTRAAAAKDLQALGESKAALSALERSIVERDKEDSGGGDATVVKALAQLVSGQP
jgi:hypothetical protein